MLNKTTSIALISLIFSILFSTQSFGMENKSYSSYGLRRSNWSRQGYREKIMRESVEFEPGIDTILEYQSAESDISGFSYSLLAALRSNEDGSFQLSELYGIFKKGPWLTKLETGTIKGQFKSVPDVLISSRGNTFENDYTYLSIGREIKRNQIYLGLAYLEFTPPIMLVAKKSDDSLSFYLNADVRQRALGLWIYGDGFKPFLATGKPNTIKGSVSVDVLLGVFRYGGFEQAKNDFRDVSGLTLKVKEDGEYLPAIIAEMSTYYMYKSSFWGSEYGVSAGIMGRAHITFDEKAKNQETSGISELDTPTDSSFANAQVFDGQMLFLWGPFFKLSMSF